MDIFSLKPSVMHKQSWSVRTPNSQTDTQPQNTQKAIQLLQHNKGEDLRQIPRALPFPTSQGFQSQSD